MIIDNVKPSIRTWLPLKSYLEPLPIWNEVFEDIWGNLFQLWNFLAVTSCSIFMRNGWVMGVCGVLGWGISKTWEEIVEKTMRHIKPNKLHMY